MNLITIPAFTAQQLDRVEVIRVCLKFFGITEDELVTIETHCTSMDDYESALNAARWGSRFDEIIQTLQYRNAKVEAKQEKKSMSSWEGFTFKLGDFHYRVIGDNAITDDDEPGKEFFWCEQYPRVDEDIDYGDTCICVDVSELRKHAGKWKLLGRNNKVVAGASISEMIYSSSDGLNRRYVATINGWRGWYIAQGYPGRNFAFDQVVERVKSIRDRIEAGDESVFHENVSIHWLNLYETGGLKP